MPWLKANYYHELGSRQPVTWPWIRDLDGPRMLDSFQRLV